MTLRDALVALEKELRADMRDYPEAQQDAADKLAAILAAHSAAGVDDALIEAVLLNWMDKDSANVATLQITAALDAAWPGMVDNT